MLRLMNHVIRREFHRWDRPSQAAFVLAVILLGMMIVIVTQTPQAIRGAALASAGAVMLTLELVVLWANRKLMNPDACAKRAFLRGDYVTTQRELEALRAAGKADLQALTLLGNTYRHLGQLDTSEQILREALAIDPNHHFPLYGFGRTLLIKGDYANAVAVFESALRAGAPAAIRADLGEALYYAGAHAQAVDILQQVLPQVADDPQRHLMVSHLLHRLGAASLPPNTAVLHDGLAYWQDLAARYPHTPYGVRLNQELTAHRSQ